MDQITNANIFIALHHPQRYPNQFFEASFRGNIGSLWFVRLLPRIRTLQVIIGAIYRNRRYVRTQFYVKMRGAAYNLTITLRMNDRHI